jgi:hypothetical protein
VGEKPFPEHGLEIESKVLQKNVRKENTLVASENEKKSVCVAGFYFYDPLYLF